MTFVAVILERLIECLPYRFDCIFFFASVVVLYLYDYCHSDTSLCFLIFIFHSSFPLCYIFFFCIALSFSLFLSLFLSLCVSLSLSPSLIDFLVLLSLSLRSIFITMRDPYGSLVFLHSFFSFGDTFARVSALSVRSIVLVSSVSAGEGPLRYRITADNDFAKDFVKSTWKVYKRVTRKDKGEICI